VADIPPSPPASRLAPPRWLDGRLVLGVLLVLVSVVVGARVLSSADRTELVWAARQDLPAGATVTDDLLREERVRLFGSGSMYLSARGPKPVGYVLRRDVRGGELVPRQALAAPGEREVRHVSVPVTAGHLPADLAAAQLVDVYLTPDPRKSATPTPTPTPGSAPPVAGPRLVLSAVPVHLVPKAGAFSAADARAVVLAVPPSDVPALVAAIGQGTVDLVRVAAPPGGPPGEAAG
jgi:hypothetical protein